MHNNILTSYVANPYQFIEIEIQSNMSTIASITTIFDSG